MYRLNLPNFEIKTGEQNGKPTIFDILRQKYVVLTPEEWVRQHFIHYLIEEKNYPQTLMANEVKLNIGTKKLRCDSILFTKELHPKMIIEYKAPTIRLTQKVFDQISIYNFLMKVDYLIVSNGIQHYCCKMDYDNQKYLFLQDIPDYQNI